ncbi:patatin-like phospholipase family protein [Brevibacillus sp. SYSU BS000544]|uniref:patatin-like phospholipase family protein n=1 Tax=Brevibacillus sp. SYSU BS000544 TaxID=3416443 RepID=UPI003CE599A9
MKADGVFEGGGVKGIALIGAVAEMEEHGYVWDQLAGTSAGSIVAALLSAGYTSRELYEVFDTLDYSMFMRRTGWTRIPIVGPMYNLFWKKGLYSAHPVEEFMNGLLRKKGIRTFGDLPKEKLRIIASDITGGQMLVLPDALSTFGINPDTFPIAQAVRMSSSIPYFFQPATITKDYAPHLIVDGALLSNFPVWLFDVPDRPRWPTFGFRLSEEHKVDQPAEIKGIASFSKALLTTMLDAHDRQHIQTAHAVRTIFIPTLGVRTTQFHLSKETRVQLYESGQNAARKFLKTWNFERYVEVFRRIPQEKMKI